MGYLIVFISVNEEEKYFLYKMKPENELLQQQKVIRDFKKLNTSSASFDDNNNSSQENKRSEIIKISNK